MVSPKKILLVEDDLFHKELIFRAFEDIDDMMIVWAGTLIEAQRLIGDSKPDLVISDWRLTDGSGIDLLISSNFVFPMILMTSFGNEELAVQSMKAGVMDYLVKSPEAFENLPQNVRRALREWDNVISRQEIEKALRESEERYRLVAEGANDVIWDYDPCLNKMIFSGRWVDLLGIEKTWCTYEEFLDLIHPEDRDMIMHEWEKHWSGSCDLFSCECRIRVTDGDYKWVFTRGKSLYNVQGDMTRFAGSFTDMSVTKHHVQRIEELAFFDTVTGLPNRVQFTHTLDQLITTESNLCSGLLFFIDIDNFKIINDTFGHSWGDRCLVEVGNMLTNLQIPYQFLCRLGGDEFIMIIDQIGECNDALSLAKRIMECFQVPLVIDDNKFYLTVSIGIASYPRDGTTVDELLKNADAAMYQSKAKGRNTYTMFDKSISQSIYEKMDMGNYLRSAIANDELLLYYQPQFEVSSGNICGLEALIRWDNPSLGFVSPLQFIRLAEEMGLIVPIGYWVIRRACYFGVQLYRKYPNLYISVNLSSVQLMQSDFVDQVKNIIQQAGIPPSMIRLEITESMLMESFESSIQKLVMLKDFGLKIELDDFGTGYSSLNYLKGLPIHTVKIDKTFIDDIVGGQQDMNITDLIVKIAHKLGLKVVAEGVETKEQIDILAQYKCDVIQGFFISKPLPENQVKHFLDSHTKM